MSGHVILLLSGSRRIQGIFLWFEKSLEQPITTYLGFFLVGLALLSGLDADGFIVVTLFLVGNSGLLAFAGTAFSGSFNVDFASGFFATDLSCFLPTDWLSGFFTSVFFISVF